MYHPTNFDCNNSIFENLNEGYLDIFSSNCKLMSNYDYMNKRSSQK